MKSATTPADASAYRPCAGILLLNAANDVFVAQRIDSPPRSRWWQMPQGGIDPHETPLTAALRELEEETSIPACHVTCIQESHHWYFYDLPAALPGKLWGGRYKGQRQRWFALRYLGTNDAINLQTATPEFWRWRWIHHQMLERVAIPFKRDTYRRVVAEFRALGVLTQP